MGVAPRCPGWIQPQRVPLEPGTGWKSPSAFWLCLPAQCEDPHAPPGLGPSYGVLGRGQWRWPI